MSDQPPAGAGDPTQAAGPPEGVDDPSPPTVFGDQPPVPDAGPTVQVPPQPAPPTGGGPGAPGGPGGPDGPDGPYDDEPQPWYKNPGAVAVLVVLAIIVLVLLFLILTSGDDGGEDETPETTFITTTTSTTVPTTTSTTTTTTSTTTTSTTTTTTTTSTTAPPSLEPGDPCSPEEGEPDCIDPEGDGTYVYLIGGAECIANAPDPSACADEDGDGIAGSFVEGD